MCPDLHVQSVDILGQISSYWEFGTTDNSDKVIKTAELTVVD